MQKTIADIGLWLQERKDPRVLFLFRIVYGLFMTYEMIDYFRIGLIRNMFFLPAINFRYDYLTWLKPLPEPLMNGLLYLLLISAVCITLGVFFKWSTRIFALGYAYLFLLDKSIYNNHIYLFILLAFLLSFTNADKGLSLAKRSVPPNFRIPRWQILSLQLQIMIVYFYGGIAKITYDWLVQCQPVRILLDNLSPEHFLAPVLKNDLAVYVFTYGGFLIDILAPLLLWSRTIRRWAIYPFIIFHLTNSRVFSDIGIFPYLMLFALMLFYEARDLPVLNRLLPSDNGDTKPKGSKPDNQDTKRGLQIVNYVMIPYFIVQLVFPFRGHFLPNQLDWTTIGNRFSWRMKVDTRQLEEIRFTVFDPATNQNYPVNIQTKVNDMQINNMSMDPRSVADFAKLLKKEALAAGIASPQVLVNIKLKYNGRPTQDFVVPGADIAAVHYSPFRKLDWVVPLKK